MKPKFTAGQRLIHFGKTVEVVEVTEDTFGSLNQYRLKADDGTEFEAYENTLSVIKDKIENKIVCPVVEKAKEYQPKNRVVAVKDNTIIAREINDDTIPEETQSQDLIDLFKKPDPPPRRAAVDGNKVRAALKTGKLEDLMKLFDE